MTGRQLFAAIGEIDETMLAEANREPERRSLRWLAAVAALALTAGAAVTFFAVRRERTPPVEPADPTVASAPETTAVPTEWTAPTEVTTPTEARTGPGGLPLLSLEGLTDIGGMGGYGYVYAGSFEEIVLSRVWEDAPGTLPVWQMAQSWFSGDYTGQVEAIRRVAEAVGDPIPENAVFNSYRGIDSPDAADGRSTWIDTDRFRYGADSEKGCLTLIPASSLNLGDPSDWAEELQSVFPGLFAEMKKPASLVIGGDRSWKTGEDGNLRRTDALWTLHIYDADDPDGECAAFLKGVQVALWDSGEVECLYVYLPEYYEKLGDYPVLTRDQALAALESAYGACRVMGAELTYEGLSLSRLRAPVWRFLLEDKGQNGLSLSVPGTVSFTEIYVPAIPPEYLETEQNGETFPTGYPSGEMQCEMLYYKGTVYIRDFSVDPIAVEETVPPAYTPVGETTAEINDREPDEELAAARAPVGTPVYLDARGRPWLLKEGRLLLLRPCTEKD